jgi:hypothetical protein
MSEFAGLLRVYQCDTRSEAFPAVCPFLKPHQPEKQMHPHKALTVILTLALPGCEPARIAAFASTDAEASKPLPAASVAVFPDVISLPDGFWPEGITFGRGSIFYTGSLATGAIWRGDAATGAGSYLVEPHPGRELVGMKYHAARDRLVVAGGGTGEAFVFDATSGAEIAKLQLGDPAVGTLVNDVALFGDAAYFTDSYQPVIYKVKLGSSNDVERIHLTGDFEFDANAMLGNLNGIVALPGGRELIAVNMADGGLYVIDVQSGYTTRVDLGAAAVPGDGLLLIGNTIYVVEGYANQITPVRMHENFRSGTVQAGLHSENFQFPSTIAPFGKYLYAVNARFDVAYAPNVTYTVARIAR